MTTPKGREIFLKERVFAKILTIVCGSSTVRLLNVIVDGMNVGVLPQNVMF